MGGKPGVSVVIPAFNAEAFIADALGSLLGQTMSAREIIVVSDGSTDGTAGIVRQFAEAVLIEIPHQGVSAARNTGVAASTGELLAFLDADDTWHPRKLELQAELLASHPEVGVALCRHTYAFEGPIPVWFRGPRDGSPPPGYLLISGLIRRTVWDIVGPFDPTLTHGEDGDWLFRAIDLGVQTAVVEEPLMTYRIHGSNASGEGLEVRSGILRALRASVQRKHGVSA